MQWWLSSNPLHQSFRATILNLPYKKNNTFLPQTTPTSDMWKAQFHITLASIPVLRKLQSNHIIHHLNQDTEGEK